MLDTAVSVTSLEGSLSLAHQVGLGTDVAGGYSCSILDCIRQAIVAANVISLQPDENGTMWNALR